MHIAFLTPEYPHEKVAHAAGIGTSIRNLVVTLAKKKLKFRFLCMDSKKMLCLPKMELQFI